jgi:hypothetical protein
MRPVVSLGLLLFFCLGALAQQNPGPAPAGRSFPPRYVLVPANPVRTYGSPSGFGSVLFPGLGTPPPATNAFSVGTFGGVRFRGGHRGGGAFAYPMPYPVFVGGGYYGDPSSYAYPPPQAPAQPNITIVMPPAQANPPVIINQYGPESVPQAGGAAPPAGDAQLYQSPSGPQPDDRVTFFIALKDSSVYTAVAYWVEDGTLHYITPEGRHNQVSLDLVDRRTSATLNDGRKVEFRLPAEK